MANTGIYSPINITTGQVTIGTSPTLIRAFEGNRIAIAVIQHGTTDVFIGSSSVTIGTGALLVGVKGASIAVQTRAALYGVVQTGTQTVSWMTDGDTP